MAGSSALEHLTLNQEVGGSNPPRPTTPKKKRRGKLHVVNPAPKIHEKIKDLKFIKEMMEVEAKALKMLKPVPVETLRPKVVLATPKTLPYFHYWRTVISSEPQNRRVAKGRQSPYFMFDETSKGLLGVFLYTDSPPNDPFLEPYLGWDKHDIPKEKWKTANDIKNTRKRDLIHTLLLLRRCLPLYEFGDLTGGKCLTYAALSKELIRAIEIEYSFKVSLLQIKTLHGKASQYNRIDGLEYLGIDPVDKLGQYIFELRKNATAYLRGEKPDMGKFLVKPFAENMQFWRERWLLPRAERQGVTTIEFNPDNYRVSKLM